jgi:uncharacterized protein (DUF1330 family)
MTAYVIAEVEIKDPETFKAYGPLVQPTLAQYGGKIVVSGRASVTPLEGDPPKRYVLIAFDDTAAAKRWHDSPEYREAKAIRMKSTASRLFIVE